MAWDNYERLLRLERIAIDLESAVDRNGLELIYLRQKVVELWQEFDEGNEPPAPPTSVCIPCRIPLLDLDCSYIYNTAATICAGVAGMAGAGTMSTTLRYLTDPSSMGLGAPAPGSGYYWLSDCINIALSCFNDFIRHGGALTAAPFSRVLLQCDNSGTALKLIGYRTNDGHLTPTDVDDSDCTGTPFLTLAVAAGGTARPASTCSPLNLIFNAAGVTGGASVTPPP